VPRAATRRADPGPGSAGPSLAPGVAAAAPTGSILDRRLLVVTGKGGVGKTTIACGLALAAAERGQRVLLVDVESTGGPAQRFEHAAVGFEPVEVHERISAMALDTEAALQEYLRVQLHVPLLGRVGPIARLFDFVATAAPGVREILTIGKVGWEVREAAAGRRPWDLVVVDAAASGHVVAQLDAPRAIRELVAVGPVRAQTEWLGELLADPVTTGVVVVCTPEEMPVAETIELVHAVRDDLELPLAAVVVNRVLPAPLTRADEPVFAALSLPAARQALAAAAGPGATRVLDGAGLAAALRRARAGHLARLRAELDLPLVLVPQLYRGAGGIRGVRVVAEALVDELGL
jgi:anion-transporting  ArsA/GET3 family ATPase